MVIRRAIVHGSGKRDWLMRVSIVIVVDQVAIKVGPSSFLFDERWFQQIERMIA